MRVANYARVSTRDKGRITDNQLPNLRHYAEAHSWTIYKEYSEEESGGTANRTQFQQLFVDAHQRRFDVVLFRRLDRFSRKGVLPTLEQWGVEFKSYTEQFLDSTGIFKVAVISVLAVVAKQERVRLGERTKSGLARTRAKGTVLGRKAIDPVLVAQIAQLSSAGHSERVIAAALSRSKGVVAKHKKPAALLASN